LIGWFSCAFRNLGEKKFAGKSLIQSENIEQPTSNAEHPMSRRSTIVL
jgi:hypothetical protein